MRQRVLVTVRREEETDGGRDLELPSELRADELTRLLGTALHWPHAGSDLRVRIEPGGRVLEAGESLAEAGAADGALLVFSSASPPAEPAAATPEWPTFMLSRPAAPERRMPTRLLLVLGGGVVMLSVAGLLVLRPAPPASPVATSVPTAVPTVPPALQPTPLLATLEPTRLPPPPTAAPIIQPTLAPTAAPTPLPTAAPTAPPPTPLPSPTPRPRLPTVVATTVAQDALAPPPQTQEPPPAISAPSRPPPAPVGVAQPPPPAIEVEAPPPRKLKVTRDGFAPPENDR